MANSNTAVAQPTLILGEGAAIGKRVFPVRSTEIDALLFDAVGLLLAGGATEREQRRRCA
jgi:hypothetical protein